MTKSITRATFEKRLGGTWEKVEGIEVRRHNQKWITWKAPSQRVQGRIDCFCRRMLEGSPIYAGPSWAAVARVMHL